jgi:hypothetical protein
VLYLPNARWPVDTPAFRPGYLELRLLA